MFLLHACQCAWEGLVHSYKSRELVLLQREEREGVHGDVGCTRATGRCTLILEGSIARVDRSKRCLRTACAIRRSVRRVRWAGVGSEGREQEVMARSMCDLPVHAPGTEGGRRERGTGARAVGVWRARYVGPYGGRASGARVGNEGRKQEVMACGVHDPPVRAPGTEGGHRARGLGARDGSEVVGQELRRVARGERVPLVRAPGTEDGVAGIGSKGRE
ncbi:hypothetical protein K488DRAFT_73773 [Vararia minispora EC-137]|uniref:Uncharacterized protein n=1 Tax=Vararia minispora EC-137 TaxID=1314806 RepID=A0ACB8Q9G9_9AGAM|nr:hypothetical protein K488DRAFT_73773 [Vararia minispora EC-137]